MPPTNRRRGTTPESAVAPSTPLTEIPDGPLADMCHRVGLTMLLAIDTSEELWPDRIKALPDIQRYLDWHEIVRPGGRAHTPTDLAKIAITAGSVEELSRALIVELDRFHQSRMDPGFILVDAGLQVPAGSVPSLAGFFQNLR